MLFKPKFFLDLGGGEGDQKPAVVAPTKPAAVAPAKTEPAQAEPAKPEPAKAASAPVVQAEAASAPALSSPSVTTTEAIAAELAAAQANRPAPSLATFAPDCLTPGGGLPQRRRRGAADLAGFKAMAQSMMRS
jgi:hypothetical protein